MPPTHVRFFHEDCFHLHRPTVIIYEDGTFKENRIFGKTKKVTILLFKHSSVSPNRKQLDLAERFASAAVSLNPECVLEFGPSTSPWTYDFFARELGNDFANGIAGGEG